MTDVIDENRISHVVTLNVNPLKIKTYENQYGTKWAEVPLKGTKWTIKFINKQVIPNLRNIKIMYFNKTKFSLIYSRTEQYLIRWGLFSEFLPELRKTGLVLNEKSHVYDKKTKTSKEIIVPKNIDCPSADKLFQKLGI